MKIHILGAGGSKTPQSSFISILIDDILALDAGNITSALDLKAQAKIKYILISHSHLDHIKDICFLADNRVLLNSMSFYVFASEEVIKHIKTHIFNDIIWPDFTKIPSQENPVLFLKSIPKNTTFSIEEYEVLSLKVKHSLGARGYFIKKENKTLFYTGDIGFDKNFWKSLKDFKIDVLFVDISYSDRLKELALKTNHLTPSLFIECIKELNSLPSKIYAVHSKFDFAEEIIKNFKKVSEFFPEVTLLQGGEVFEI